MNLNDEKVILQKGLTTLNNREREIQMIKQRLEACFEQDNMIRAEEVAFELNDAYEKQVQISRGLPVYIRRPMKINEPEHLVPDNEQADVGFTKEGWFCAKIPALLPKKEKGSPDYIRNILYAGMIRFFRDKDPVRYPDVVMVFRHIYNKKRSHRQYRDHDNIEVNAVVDIMALYLLHGDDPTRCNHYHCTSVGEQDETQVFVVPKREIIKWIYDVELGEKNEIVLYEKIPK